MPLHDPHEDAMMRLAAGHVVPLPRPPRTGVDHATMIYHDERNHARTVHGIGFRPRCDCGESFRVVASYGMARAALREHLTTVHRAVEREAVPPTTGTAA